MSSLTTRLGKLTPALSAKERAILMLRAHNADTPPDPDILHSMPREQSPEYNRYAGLAYAASADLGSLLGVIRMRIDSLEYDSEQIDLIKEAAGILAQELEETPSDQKVRAWRKHKTVSVPEFLLGVAFDLATNQRQQIVDRWQELRALELVWAEIALEFDGEDPVHPDLRANASDAAQRVQDLATAAGMPKKALTKPAEALVESVRDLVTRPMQLMHLIKEETS